jgi:hypothetical protein
VTSAKGLRTRLGRELILDTRAGEVREATGAFKAGDRYPLEGRSLALLRLRRARGRA